MGWLSLPIKFIHFVVCILYVINLNITRIKRVPNVILRVQRWHYYSKHYSRIDFELAPFPWYIRKTQRCNRDSCMDAYCSFNRKTAALSSKQYNRQPAGTNSKLHHRRAIWVLVVGAICCYAAAAQCTIAKNFSIDSLFQICLYRVASPIVLPPLRSLSHPTIQSAKLANDIERQ